MGIHWGKAAAIGLALALTIVPTYPLVAGGQGWLHSSPTDRFILVTHEEGPQREGPERDGPWTGVFINEQPLRPEQFRELQATYGAVAPPGRYWYDPRSGLYGIWGREAVGFIRPGHNFGPLPADASQGNTGVFINGRQINMIEARYFQQLFGVVYQGRWWLDGMTGNIGLEGNPMPMVNLFFALQQSQQSRQGGGGGGGYRWRDNWSGGSGGVQGRCVFANMPGGSVMGSGC